MTARIVNAAQKRVSTLILVALIAVMTGALSVLSVRSAAAGTTHTITIENFSFNPDTVKIKPGDTVTWVNHEQDGTVHTVTSDTFSSPDIAPGGSYSHTFTNVGSIDYHCIHHTYMTGTVVVSATASTGPTTKPGTRPTKAPSKMPTSAPKPTHPAGTTKPASARNVGASLSDGTFLANYSVDAAGVKVFHLTAAPMKLKVDGKVKQAYAFNGVVPGPTIRVGEGDRIRILVTNHLQESTAVHWHGMELPNAMDGVPGMTQKAIKPGATFTYEYTAVSTGTHWYHSHMGGNQVGRGLYGALEVVPKSGDFPADHDYTEEISDGALGFVFNGRSFPNTVPLQAKVGETVHLRLIGTGPELIHPIHLHGMPFQVVAQDGYRLASPYYADTLMVGVGQTYDLLFTPVAPGHWMLHCHIFSHSEGPNGMRGLVTTVEVAPADAAATTSSPQPTAPAPGAPSNPLISIAPLASLGAHNHDH